MYSTLVHNGKMLAVFLIWMYAYRITSEKDGLKACNILHSAGPRKVCLYYQNNCWILRPTIFVHVSMFEKKDVNTIMNVRMDVFDCSLGDNN
jgi:hypothetical protein